MPINGLTNSPRSFLKIGQIRKGEMKEFTRSDGSKYKAPVDLDYFRVTFRPDEPECAAEFVRIYGETPRRINIRFPFQTIEENWDANYECYSRGGLIAKASSDQNGLHWVFYRDYATAEVWVRNGSPVGEAGREFFEKPIDVNQPIYSYRDTKGNTVNAFLETVGRLQVVVPEIAHLRVGYLEFRPGSPKDIAAISRELAGIDMLARQNHRDLSGIPLALTRREDQITKNMQGKLVQDVSWLVHIELTGSWGQKALEVLERNAFPEIVDGEVRELPLDEEWDGNMEGVTETVEPEAPPAVPAKTTAVPAKPTVPAAKPAVPTKPAPTAANPDRPYPPETFREKFHEVCATMQENYEKEKKTCDVSEHQRKVLVAVLSKYCFKGNTLFRHEFLGWLCDEVSTSNLTCCQVKTLFLIMGITGNDFDQAPSEVAVQEIVNAHKFAVKKMVK